jgi:hypothetical protein
MVFNKVPKNQIVCDLYEEDERKYKIERINIGNISNATSNKNSRYYNQYINLDLLGIDQIDHSAKTLNKIVYYVKKISGHMPSQFSNNNQSIFWMETVSPIRI